MDYNKFRRLVGVFFALFLLVLARPPFFYPALVLVGLGIAIRLWAAGYIHKNEEVTTAGPYGLVRHPLYLGSFCLGLGLSLFIRRFWVVHLYLLFFGAVYAKKIRMEEEFLLAKFGEAYRAYRARIPVFFPWPGWGGPKGQKGAVFSWKNVRKNREHRNTLAFVFLLLLMHIYGYLIWPLLFG